MDLSNYKKVEHKDGRIELIPIKKESQYLTLAEASKLKKEINEISYKGGNMLIGNSGTQSLINLDVSLGSEELDIPFKIFINGEYDLEYVKESASGAKQYIFKKKK